MEYILHLNQPEVETQVVNGNSVAVKTDNDNLILPDQAYGLQVYNHFREEVPA